VQMTNITIYRLPHAQQTNSTTTARKRALVYTTQNTA